MGLGKLCIIDRDLIEHNNLQRQTLFSEEDIGSLKAETAFNKLKKINSEINLHYMAKDLNHTNMEEIIKECDLVVDATDNIPTRLLINDVCVKNKIPWIYAGVIETRGMMMNITSRGPCFRCLIDDAPKPGSIPTCETAGIINTIPAIMASIQCTEAVKILLNKPFEKDLLTYDVWEQRFEKIEINRDPECECCKKGKFKFLDQEKKEIITELCERGVQIIPAEDMNLDLNKIPVDKKEKVMRLTGNDFFIKFTLEEKTVTLFKDGRAIIKGIGDRGAAKAFYSRFLGL